MSDGNSTGKEKKKKDDIIISKNQKSKAPPPVFVIADNMDANLLKFMNKNKNKTSPPKNILLEESHASQISSENYGNDDDDEGEEFVGEQHEKNNLGLSGSASQSFIDDDSDGDNDNLKMEIKKKEVEKTKNIQSQKIYQSGLNDNSIEEDGDSNDDDHYDDNDKYSVDDKNEDEEEDESVDLEPPQKFKISSFSGISNILIFYKIENSKHYYKTLLGMRILIELIYPN